MTPMEQIAFHNQQVCAAAKAADDARASGEPDAIAAAVAALEAAAASRDNFIRNTNNGGPYRSHRFWEY
jgi:hypothetical protein